MGLVLLNSSLLPAAALASYAFSNTKCTKFTLPGFQLKSPSDGGIIMCLT